MPEIPNPSRERDDKWQKDEVEDQQWTKSGELKESARTPIDAIERW